MTSDNFIMENIIIKYCSSFLEIAHETENSPRVTVCHPWLREADADVAGYAKRIKVAKASKSLVETIKKKKSDEYVRYCHYRQVWVRLVMHIEWGYVTFIVTHLEHRGDLHRCKSHIQTLCLRTSSWVAAKVPIVLFSLFSIHVPLCLPFLLFMSTIP